MKLLLIRNEIIVKTMMEVGNSALKKVKSILSAGKVITSIF